MLTELSRYNFIGVAFSRSYRGHSWWILVAFAICYSPIGLTSDRLLSNLMWFLCRSWHNRYVEFGSSRKVIGFCCVQQSVAPPFFKVSLKPPNKGGGGIACLRFVLKLITLTAILRILST